MKTLKISIIFSISLIALAVVACGSTDESPAADSTTPPAAVADQSDSATKTSTDGTYVVTDGSEATFTVNEQLSRLPLPNDAVLRTGEISGEIDLSTESSSLVIDLHSLESDDSKRDRYVRDRLFPTQSTATITISDFPDVPAQFAEGEAFTSTVTAIVNVNGAEAEIEFSFESRLDLDRLLVLVKGDFTWADFGMTAPTSNFFVVRDEVHVEVLISAVPK